MNSVKRVWWVHGLRGLFAVAYGVFALTLPVHALRYLMILFGCFALADGVFALWSGRRGDPDKEHLRATLAEGATGMVLGVVTLAAALFAPQIAERVIVYLIAVWAGLTGLLEIFNVDKRNHVSMNDWQFIAAGILSIACAALLLRYPDRGIAVFTMLLGAYLVLFGGLLLHLAWRLYNRGHRFPHHSAPAQASNLKE